MTCGNRILKEDGFEEFPNQPASDSFLHASVNLKYFQTPFFLSDCRNSLSSLCVVQMLHKDIKQKS